MHLYIAPLPLVKLAEFSEFIRVFPKIDCSEIAARIVIEQNKFSKAVTSDRD